MSNFSWNTPSNLVKLVPLEDYVHNECYRVNHAWRLTGADIEKSIIKGYSAVKYTINIQRLPDYYIMNVALPILLLSIVGMLVFVSPAEAQEKSVLVVTIMACYIAILLLVKEITPHTPGTTPLLGENLYRTHLASRPPFFAKSYIACTKHHAPVKNNTVGLRI